MAVQVDGGFAERKSYLYRHPDLTYRVDGSVISGKVDGILSIAQSAFCILMTERYSSPIYSDDYGVELEQYVNKDIGYIKAGIEDTLRDALTHDDRITDVVVNSVKQSDDDSSVCVVDFSVYTIYGEYEQKLVIS